MLVVPTSTILALPLFITSGMRKEPPISTSWPRNTHDLAAPGQGIEGNEDGGRVVVDHGSCFSAGNFLENPLHMGIAASSFSPLKVIFQIAVAACDGLESCESPFSEYGSAEVRVSDYAGGIDQRLQTRLVQENQFLGHHVRNPLGGSAVLRIHGLT